MIETIRTRRMIPKYIEVQNDIFEWVEIYKTSDGQIFNELRDATAHEADKKFEKVENISFCFPMIGNTWYKAKDEDELEFLIEHMSKSYGGRRYGERDLKPGEWFTHVVDDKYGQGPTDHFLKLSELKNSFSELLKLLENRSKK